MTDLLVVVGARPNFVKAAPLLVAAADAGLECMLVHTGQHYDGQLSQALFDDLELPTPSVELHAGSGSHAVQTATIMRRFERTLLDIRPAIVVVVGDVNSTLACALVAAKERYPVAHVEAGLRCFDEHMPEEINRRLTDHLSQFLFTTCRDADDNLAREGIASDRVMFAGNTMIDALMRSIDAAREREAPRRLGLAPGGYAVATLHRPENVDDDAILSQLVAALVGVSSVVPVVLPVHPRTKARLARAGLLDVSRRLRLIPPAGYLDFLGLVADAGVVLTDSGGVQEETTALGVPCVTLRETTERPITVRLGTNVIAGSDPVRIIAAAVEAIESARPPVPELPRWDGRASERVVARLAGALQRDEVALAAA